MSGFVKKLLIVSGVMVVMTGLVIFLFVQSMEPEEEGEDRVLRETTPYIAEHFKDAKVLGVLYDNMSNYFTFDYAVQLYDAKTDTEFLVYVDQTTNEVADTFLTEKWSKELMDDMRPLVEKVFGKGTEYRVIYEEEDVRKLKIQPSNPMAYRDAQVLPFITFTLNRNRVPNEEENLARLATVLQTKKILQHGNLKTEYVDDQGVVREGEVDLNKSF
ncbi:hypothetical protein D3D03_04365 [Exiguobacterium sp. RIT452]|uniref:hypothetical protein n=1 Tax=Exiguobacterium TaxID=33986 RepID=UPI00047C6637|nr:MULTISPECIES: hypothetical protein [Exiguobacterium]RJP02586.1 hypothetical protein D3D03_04365 [Exiguobacterium sp. RIT452]